MLPNYREFMVVSYVQSFQTACAFQMEYGLTVMRVTNQINCGKLTCVACLPPPPPPPPTPLGTTSTFSNHHKHWVRIYLLCIQSCSWAILYDNTQQAWGRVLTHLHSDRPKEAWQIWKYFTYKSIFLKTIKIGMLIRRWTTTLLQIFYEILLYWQVIYKK